MSTTTSPRGTYSKTPARRAEILEAAFAVFSASGYENGSIRDIAERVGVSPATVLFHFSSKAELLADVLEMRDEQSRERFWQTRAPGMDHLRALLELVRENVGHPGMIELYTVLAAEATAPDHPAREYFRNRYEFITGQAHTAFLALRDQELLRPGVEPGHAARTLIAMVDGLQLQWLHGSDSLDMVSDIKTHMQSLVTQPL